MTSNLRLTSGRSRARSQAGADPLRPATVQRPPSGARAPAMLRSRSGMVGEGAAVILYRVLSFNKNCKKLTGMNRMHRMNIGGKAHPGLELVPGLKSGMNGRHVHTVHPCNIPCCYFPSPIGTRVTSTISGGILNRTGIMLSPRPPFTIMVVPPSRYSP